MTNKFYEVIQEDKINIELKSESLNEVLSAPPSWLVRSGNSLFFMVIVLVLTLSYLISYPDEIIGEVMIYNNRPPVEFENLMYGRLVDLKVKDGEEVKQGEIVAQFDNKINPTEIQKVQSFLSTLKHLDLIGRITVSESIRKINLGVLQQNWATLLSQVSELESIKSSDLYAKKINALRFEIEQRKQLNSIAQNKLKLIEQEITIQNEQTQSAKRLYAKNAISKDELLTIEKTENQMFHSFQNQKEVIIQNEIQISNLTKNLSELEFEAKQQIQKLSSSIQSTVNTLLVAIQSWEINTAWKAPFAGKILFNRQLNVNNFYKAGDASLVLVPNGNKFNGLIKVKAVGSGKIKRGQKVFIELSDFPKNDYGMLEAKVKSITSIAKEDTYEVGIKLPKQLLTSFKKKIPTKAILKGNAKIITKNKRLLERFFEKVISLVEK